MRGILRDEWGFDGVVISDWAAIWELLKHGIAEEEDEAAALAVKAGVDIDMMTEIYANHLKKLVEEGKVEEKLIDEAAYRILRLKNRLGLFENPYKNADEVYDEALEIEEEHRALARAAAAESFCTAQKNDGILPLVKKRQMQQKNSQHTGMALIGPYVKGKSRSADPGHYSGSSRIWLRWKRESGIKNWIKTWLMQRAVRFWIISRKSVVLA